MVPANRWRTLWAAAAFANALHWNSTTSAEPTALASLVAAHPELKGIGIAEAWGGTIDSTPDAIPVISAVGKLPGFFLATGFSGHGFGIGPAAGRLAADVVTGDRPLVDPANYAYDRLVDGRRLEPAGLL